MKRIVLSLGAVFASVVLNAQDNNGKNNDSLKTNRLEEVIITATRTPEIVKKSAATVYVITRKEIEHQTNISSDMSNILSYTVPGLGFGNNTVGNRGQTMRGRNPLIMIDGIPQSSPLRNNDREIRTIDPSIIERIEVIKGATSIYGSGAEGGIINFITLREKTNKPISGRTVLNYNTHDIFNDKMFKSEGGAGYRVSQTLYGKLGKFDYLVSGSFTNNGVKIGGDELIQNPRYGLGETKVANAYAKLGYSFDKKSRLEYMFNYYSSLQDSKYVLNKGKYLVTPSTGVLGTGLGDKEGTKYNYNQYLKYSNTEIFKNTSLNATFYAQNFYTIYDYRAAPRWKTGGQSAILEKKLGLRADFTTDFKKNDRLNASLTYGVDLLNEKTQQPLVDGRVWVPELNMMAFAPFIQSKFYLTEYLTAKAGVRWDMLNVKVPDYTTLTSENELPYNVDGGTLKYKNFSYNAGVSYTEIEFFQPFTSISRGFNIFDLGRTLRDAKSNVLGEINTEPVVVDSYEVGFNSKIGQYADFTASYFYNYSKLGADLVSENGFWVPLRAPQYVSGVDLLLNVYPINGLNVAVNYTFQDGKVDEEGDGSYSKYLSGLRIAAPRFNASANWTTLNKKLNLGLYYMHSFKRDRFRPDVKNIYEDGEGPVKSFDLFNFQGSYKIAKFVTLGVGVENLFNKKYFTPTSMFTARDNEYVRGNGRYYTLSLSFNY